jgi:uncharacterized protein YjiS (DUF1127 family)
MSPWTSWGAPDSGLRAMAATARSAAFIQRVRRVMRRHRELAELPDYLLKDIGLTRAQVRREALRAFWDLPAVMLHPW